MSNSKEKPVFRFLTVAQRTWVHFLWIAHSHVIFFLLWNSNNKTGHHITPTFAYEYQHFHITLTLMNHIFFVTFQKKNLEKLKPILWVKIALFTQKYSWEQIWCLYPTLFPYAVPVTVALTLSHEFSKTVAFWTEHAEFLTLFFQCSHLL